MEMVMSDKKLLTDKIPMIPRYRVLSRVSILAETLDFNHEMMNVPAMWKSTKGAGVKVVVLDTGVPNHMDLQVQGGKSFIPGYEEDKNGHGTHVGGIIAAIANNGMGVAGIAPDCEDSYGSVLDGSGSGTIKDIIAGIRWAVDEVGAHIINMSLGIDASAPIVLELEEACDYARDQGCLVICAAGNENWNVGQPAVFDSTVAVAAVNHSKERANFSNYGPEVMFSAGGVDVYSTYLNNAYVKLSGTSMASPALAGIAALIIADDLKADKKLSPDGVIEKLKKISFDVGDDGFDELYGYGVPVFVTPTEPEQPEQPDEPEQPEQPEDGPTQPDEPTPPEGGQSPCNLGLPMAKVFLSAAVSSIDNPGIQGYTHTDRVANAVGEGLRAVQKFVGRIEQQGRETRNG
jgi:subtilisin family serine protease